MTTATAANTKDWYEVDRKGLANILERRGKGLAIMELVSNALDENAGTITVNVKATARGKARVEVEDDSPDGWTALSNAWTLFAPSPKAGTATKRGRFNLGEKLVLAGCDSATIDTTGGQVLFNENGRHTDTLIRRAKGTKFTAQARLTAEDLREVNELMQVLIVPEGKTVIYNGTTLGARKAIATFTAALQTELEADDGALRRVTRETEVRVYTAMPGQKTQLYELGVPVVETGDAYDVSVGQKIPLNLERDNVLPGFLRAIRTAVLDATYTRITTQEEATAPWVRAALPKASAAAVGQIMDKRFGKKRVAYDPSDQEANKIAVSRGYTLVTGGAMGGEEWKAVKTISAVLPAGQVTPSPKVVANPEGEAEIVNTAYTDTEQAITEYTKALGQKVLGYSPQVQWYAKLQDTNGGHDAAAWARHVGISYSRAAMKSVGRDAREGRMERLDALLIHEFAHERVGDHLSSEFHNELCRIGAAMRRSSPTGLELA